MTAGSALITGTDASPQMVEKAVRQALGRAGLDRANGVLLMLSRDFNRGAGQAVLAAARTAGCLQVAGAIADGLFNESGWALNQAAVAVLVVGGKFALMPTGSGAKLCFSESAAPFPERVPAPCLGLFHNGPVWQQARPTTNGRAETTVTGADWVEAVSPGLRLLAPPLPVSAVRSFDVLRVGEQSVADHLARILPFELRDRDPFPTHLLAALPDGRMDLPAIPLLSINADGSATLARPLTPGNAIAWAIRQPLAAENDMRETLARAANRLTTAPAFGIQFSCIGRGPLFYDGDDRDLAAWNEHFPGVPMIGAYGSGQLAPAEGVSRQWQNTVVTAIFAERHV